MECEHEVISNGYSLSITYRVQKQIRALSCLLRPQGVPATTDTDPKELSEVRQEINRTMDGQKMLSQELRDALNRLAASTPTRRARAREVIW